MKGEVSMISAEILFQIIVQGRLNSYVKGDQYKETVGIYNRHYEKEFGEYLFSDSYHGFNPYSGVEYIYIKGSRKPIWYCDYVGFVKKDSPIPDREVYTFLREARGNQLERSRGTLLLNYSYENGPLRYDTNFSGDMNNLLQFENFYYNDNFVAQQISGGRYCGAGE